MATRLHPTFRARAAAVKAAHAHLAQTHPRWTELSPTERIKAVHAHVDRPAPTTLRDHVTQLRRSGRFGTTR